LLAAFDDRIRPVLLVAVVPAALSVLVVAVVVEHRRATTTNPTIGQPRREHARLPRSLRRVLLVLGAFSLVNLPDALLLLRAAELGLSASEVVAAYVLSNVVAAALALPAGVLADRCPHRVLMGVGLLCFATTYGTMSAITDPIGVWPLMAVYGAFAACTDGVGKAWVSSLVDHHQLGRAHGTYQATLSLGVLAAGVWGGAAWAGSGRLPLAIAAIVAGGLALVLLAWPHWDFAT
jgi:MFS family permease